MARTESILVAPIPRSILSFGLPAAFVILTLFFVALGFPYHQLIDKLLLRVEQSTGMRIEIGEPDMQIGLLGPGFAIEEVSAIGFQGAEPMIFESVYVRPAWSFSWLIFSPAIHLEAGTPFGQAYGVVTLGSGNGWDGTLEGVDLERLPLGDGDDVGARISGTMDADFDVVMSETGDIDGSVSFEVGQGILRHADLGFPLTFETASGEIEFGGDHLARIEELEIWSPVINVSIVGTIGAAPSLNEAPLDLELHFSDIEGFLRPAIQPIAPQISDDGKATARVGGAWADPQFLPPRAP